MTAKTSRTVKTAKTKAKRGAEPEKKMVVNMRFDPALLARLDEAAKRRGVNRTAWVHWAVSELLDA
jgi:predicted HicB family RNase H-like nuclease